MSIMLSLGHMHCVHIRTSLLLTAWSSFGYTRPLLASGTNTRNPMHRAVAYSFHSFDIIHTIIITHEVFCKGRV